MTPIQNITDADRVAGIVLVGGLPGTGKSYFAVRLANKLQAKYINSDLTRKEMDAQGRYAFEDELNVYEEMVQRAAMELRRGRSVIVDATFFCERMREMFFSLARLMHIRPAFVEIIADERLARRRLSKRRTPREADLSVYDLVKTQYERPNVDHLVIESTDDNIDEMLDNTLAYISELADTPA